MNKISFTATAWEEYCYWLLFARYWSRRIDNTNRLIYKINNGFIEVIQCKGHYE